MTADHFIHRLAFALRVDDHFSREPVNEPVDVRINPYEAPVISREGSHRHGDGTYRWANLADGLRRVTLSSANGRWVRWDPTPLDVVVPIADPTTALRVEMWPTPLATVPAGVKAIRAKLVGASVSNLRVEIDGFGVTATGRWTRTDASGELLYLLPSGPWPRTTSGDLDLVVAVPGRVVNQVEVRPGPVWFAGTQFQIPPQGESRIRIHVT